MMTNILHSNLILTQEYVVFNTEEMEGNMLQEECQDLLNGDMKRKDMVGMEMKKWRILTTAWLR